MVVQSRRVKAVRKLTTAEGSLPVWNAHACTRVYRQIQRGAPLGHGVAQQLARFPGVGWGGVGTWERAGSYRAPRQPPPPASPDAASAPPPRTRHPQQEAVHRPRPQPPDPLVGLRAGAGTTDAATPAPLSLAALRTSVARQGCMHHAVPAALGTTVHVLTSCRCCGPAGRTQPPAHLPQRVAVLRAPHAHPLVRTAEQAVQVAQLRTPLSLRHVLQRARP